MELDVDLTGHVHGELESLIWARFNIERVLRHGVDVQLVGDIAGHLQHNRLSDGGLRFAVRRSDRPPSDRDLDDGAISNRLLLIGPRRLRGGRMAAVEAASLVDDVESVVVDPQPTNADSVAAAAMTAPNRDALVIMDSRSSRRRDPAWDRARLPVRDVGSDGQ